MNRTKTILLSIFALSFLGMVASLSISEGTSGPGIIILGLIGVLMTATYWLALRRDWAPGVPRFIQESKARFVLGSLGIVFGLWILASTIMTAFGRFDGFELLDQPWLPIAWFATSVAITPIVKRLMR